MQNTLNSLKDIEYVSQGKHTLKFVSSVEELNIGHFLKVT